MILHYYVSTSKTFHVLICYWIIFGKTAGIIKLFANYKKLVIDDKVFTCWGCLDSLTLVRTKHTGTPDGIPLEAWFSLHTLALKQNSVQNSALPKIKCPLGPSSTHPIPTGLLNGHSCLKGGVYYIEFGYSVASCTDVRFLWQTLLICAEVYSLQNTEFKGTVWY